MNIIEHERAVIGCLLREDLGCFNLLARAGVSEQWFADQQCRTAFRVISGMRPETVNALTVSERGKEAGVDLPMITLADFVANSPIPAYLPVWLEVLRAYFLRRQLKAEAQAMNLAADDPTVDPESLAASTQARLFEAASTVDRPLKTTRSTYAEILEGWKAAKTQNGIGLTTSWPNLTALLGGYRSGKVYVVASRPGAGKSTFMGNEAFNLASANHPVSIASYEMAESELRGRILAADCDRSSFGLDTGFYDLVDIESLRKNAEAHAKLPLRINDAYQNIEQLCAWAQYEALKHKAKLIAVDYLQLIPADRRSESRNVEVARHMNLLCNTAKTLNVPFLVLSQLSRTSAHENRPPDLHDLRDSGAIEQDAYAVVFIHHETKKESEEHHSETSEFIVAKNRGGPKGSCKITFERKRQRFIP